MFQQIVEYIVTIAISYTAMTLKLKREVKHSFFQIYPYLNDSFEVTVTKGEIEKINIKISVTQEEK